VSLLHGQEPGGEQAQNRRTNEGRGRQEGGGPGGREGSSNPRTFRSSREGP
jgi:hypothetical protein